MKMSCDLFEGFVIGTCDTMCPSDELLMRTREKLLHFYERVSLPNGQYIADKSKIVKEFARSAAGIQRPKPHQLRTPATLQRTIRYLLTVILNDTRKPFYIAYDFIFDRLRAVRQEIVMQNLDYSMTIQLLEPIIMFLAYSLYRLVDEPIDKFDPKICRQHLQECLKKVLTCYDNVDETEFHIYLKNRKTIEALYLLFNLGNAEALSRAVKLPKDLRNSNLHLSIAISLSHWNRNFYRCLLLIQKLPAILCSTASLHLQTIRRELLQCFCVSYNSKALSVPSDWLKNVLFYNSIHLLHSDCIYYGISVDEQSKLIKFQRDSFQASKPIIKSRHEEFVDRLLPEPIDNIILFEN